MLASTWASLAHLEAILGDVGSSWSALDIKMANKIGKMANKSAKMSQERRQEEPI